MIPHSHEELAINNERILVSGNEIPEIMHMLVGFLKFDLGEDHLDNYIKVNENHSDSINYQLIAVIPFREREPFLNLGHCQALVCFFETISSFYLQSIITRGPPCLDLVVNF